MLELILLRHAKSDWDADFVHDRDRPLNARGRRSARAVGAHLARIGYVPEMVFTSPAVRAATTVELAVEHGRWATPIRVVDALYSGGPGDLLEVVRSAVDVERLLVAGHEPTLSTAASRFIGGGAVRVPTAALVTIRLRIPEWSLTGWGRGELQSVTLSRDLLAAGLDA